MCVIFGQPLDPTYQRAPEYYYDNAPYQIIRSASENCAASAPTHIDAYHVASSVFVSEIIGGKRAHGARHVLPFSSHASGIYHSVLYQLYPTQYVLTYCY